MAVPPATRPGLRRGRQGAHGRIVEGGVGV